ncbi:MAG: methyltransferase domain-containing protein [Myxococcota bacterium]|nr:methyltransferase domain-containing protein [Myxococcota bacterium]
MNAIPNDTSRVEAFAETLAGVLNGGALSLMISIGHRTGLFDTMARLPARASMEIAAEAGLSERYVREWLGAMVTGGIVDYDPETRCYGLPPEHAALLTRAASPSNMAATMQWVSVLAGVEDRIVECFTRGGGVPYEAFDRFHDVMAEESAQTVVAVLVDAILPLVEGLPQALDRGIDVLDVGCGAGRALNHMARAFPASRFTGYDLAPEAIETARAEAERARLGNVRFEARDVTALEGATEFDLITAFDAIHDQARPDAVLRGIAGALRADGAFLMQDIAGTSHVERDAEQPLSPFLYTISCMHCMTVSLASDGAGLGAMWGEATARRMLGEAGFGAVDVRTLPHDDLNYYYVARKR